MNDLTLFAADIIKPLLVAYALGVAYQGWSLFRSVRLLRADARVGDAAPSEAPTPAVEVVVPVKDEEKHIAACLESIVAQDCPVHRVLVVNDRSTDGTVQAVAEVQSRRSMVQRLDIAELPAGCFGKPHALMTAAHSLNQPFVAFVDSDFELRPNCLRVLVDHMTAHRLDWLAVMGRPELSMFWERLLVPPLGAVTYAWYDPRKVADPNWDDAIGSGFILARREAYEAVGGHGAVVRAYDEDSALMRVAKRAGHRVAYVLAPELFSLRLYGNFQRTVRGLLRTFVGGIKTIPRFLLTINAINFISLLPIGVFAGLLIADQFRTEIPWKQGWVAVAAAHLLTSTALAAVVYRGAGIGRHWALLHPLAAAVLIGICVRGMGELRRRAPVQWRGTSY